MFRSIIIMGMLVVSFIGHSYAENSKGDAVALVKKAAALVDSIGVEEAIKVFNNPEGGFVSGALYVFGYDTAGVIVTHPKNAKLIGKDLLNVPDVDGKFFRKEIVEVAKESGSGWVDYKYKNPETNKVQDKTTYIQKVEGIILCCGIYK